MKCPICFFAFFISVAGYSNIYNVTVTTDGTNPDQLRGAIMAAEAAGAGPHTINIAAGTYNLTMGTIVFGSAAITINFVGTGPTSTIINMTTTNQDRIININPTASISNIHVTFQGIAFTGGRLTSDDDGGGAIICGGPDNSGTFTNCAFNANTVSIGGNGAALSIQGGGAFLISQCSFSGNTNPDGGGGALYYSLSGLRSGQLSINNSVFNNNSVTATNADGGAILIDISSALSGSLTSIVDISRNVFTANHANASGGAGGAIAITNQWAAANIAQIFFNRFTGNTANNTALSAVAMFTAGAGNVDVSHNWWGCNGGPVSGSGCDKAGTITSGGIGQLFISDWLQFKTIASATAFCNGISNNTTTITAGFLQNSTGATVAPSLLSAMTGAPVSFTAALGSLSNVQTTIQSNATATATFTANGASGTGTVNAVVDNVPNNDPLARASVTINAPPSINANPAPLAICPGNEATFTVTATGSSLSYAWFKGATPLVNGQTLSGSIIAGATTSTLAIRNTTNADNSTAYNAIVTANGCSTRSGNASLSIPPTLLASSNTSGSGIVIATDFAINDGSCNRIALVEPSGAAPVNGTVSAAVTIEAGQPAYNGQYYVRRHYDITPITNAGTATALVTLYFSQDEFDSYNAATSGTINDLPVDANDITGRENLRITQFHGTGASPGNYSGYTGAGPATILITPGGGNVVWNSTNNWWEVSFPVTGFSGFYVTGLISGPLPVLLHQLTATRRQEGINIQWEVSREVEFSHYEVETSTDGRTFTTIGQVTATNGTGYSFLHNNPVSGTNYYRLKMVDLDGHFTYSRIVSCLFMPEDYVIRVLNNPFGENLQLQIDAKENTMMHMQLFDGTGRLLLQKNISLTKGRNTVDLPANRWTNGTYLLKIGNADFQKMVKVLKAG